MGKAKKGKSAGGIRPAKAGGSSHAGKGSTPTSAPSNSSGGGSRNLISANKALGQNFLKNPAIVDNIVERAAIKTTDVVLEVGPGTGNLTVKLLERAKKVVAVEYDKRMIREVLKRVEGTDVERKLQIIHGDVLKVELPFFDVLVANVPYNISSPLLFKLLAHRPLYRCAVIMFQEEFAMRLSARPGDDLYCRLSVNTQLLAKVDQLIKVGRNNFRPPPKVDSRVVRIELRNPPPPVNFTEWDGLIRLLFNRKNKTLHSVLCTKSTMKLLSDNLNTFRALEGGSAATQTSGGPASSMDIVGENNVDSSIDGPAGVKAVVEEVLAREEFTNKRPQKMDQDDFLALLAAFNEKGIHFS